jgi:Cytochrome c7 and related cytochrome c
VCLACHALPAGASSLPIDPPPQPNLPERWLEKGRFDHSKHEQVGDCESCHRFKAADGTIVRASRSTQAADVLLFPGIAACQTCHSEDAAQGAPSACTTCHVYHRHQPRPAFEAEDAGPRKDG